MPNKIKSYLIKITILIITTSFICTAAVFANAGPTFWQGYPSSEVMVIEKNNPIEVKNEMLTIDFSEESGSDYTMHGQVKASYNMVNPTSEALTVQMAFPFISKLYDLASSDIAISADSSPLNYEIYIGDAVNSGGNFHMQDNVVNIAFDDIVKTITNKPYRAKHFSEEEKGKLYTIEVKPTTEDGISLALEFEIDSDKSKVLAKGFNGYSRDGQQVELSIRCYKPEILQIFVIGEEVDFQITEYLNEKSKQKSSITSYEITTKEVDLKSYLMDTTQKYISGIDQPEIAEALLRDIATQQIYNLYAAALDKVFEANEGLSSFDEILAQNHNERILTMVYKVDFPAQSQKSINVSYKARATMDRTKTPTPIYTFNYLLNPAQNWKSFQNLNIEVFTPEDAPYVIDSNIDLTQQKDRYYTASLDSLPAGDFSFSLYAKENVSLKDKIAGALQYKLGYLMPLVLAGLMIVIVLIFVIWKIKKPKSF